MGVHSLSILRSKKGVPFITLDVLIFPLLKFSSGCIVTLFTGMLVLMSTSAWFTYTRDGWIGVQQYSERRKP
jgi:hypothetical protein